MRRPSAKARATVMARYGPAAGKAMLSRWYRNVRRSRYKVRTSRAKIRRAKGKNKGYAIARAERAKAYAWRRAYRRLKWRMRNPSSGNPARGGVVNPVTGGPPQNNPIGIGTFMDIGEIGLDIATGNYTGAGTKALRMAQGVINGNNNNTMQIG